MPNQIKINDKPVSIGVFLDDGFITIETEQKQLLDEAAIAEKELQPHI